MPPITRVITSRSSAVPVEIIRTLHTELKTIGLPVLGAESSTSLKFGSETETRVRDFQERYNLPVNGAVDETTGRILTLAALIAGESDKTLLREKLNNATHTVTDSPDYNYWLARYAIMAGDYTLALHVSPHLRDLSGIVNFGDLMISDDLGGRTPRTPEVPFPENFYSYHYYLMPQDDIDALQRSSTATVLARSFASMRPADGSSGPFEPPRDPIIWDPPPIIGPPGAPRGERLAGSAQAWLEAIEFWQFGNAEFSRQRYASAVDAYNRCQVAVLSYFSSFPDYNIQFTASSLATRVDELIWRVASDRVTWSDTWAEINWRRQLLSLAELFQFDWTQITSGQPAHIVYQLLQGNLGGSDQPPPPTNPIGPRHRKMLMDARLIIIAAVLVPLARGEANRLRRQYAAAIEDFTRAARSEINVPNSNPVQTIPAFLACEFIEVPFARLLIVETMIDQAEAQYKSRLSIEDETDQVKRTALIAILGEIALDFNTRQIPGDPNNEEKPFQHLAAAISYNGVFEQMLQDGEYVTRTKQALDTLHSTVASTVGNGDVRSIAFRSIGNTITLPTVSAFGSELPGLTVGTHPHEPYLQFNAPDGQQMRERNPRAYALLLQAQSRLLQIWVGFNYLGYRDDYTPPWRFSYLLERARYFSEHAKNAQRDYLNFLSNAESEELKEMSAAQNVEMEKASIQIETARVDQACKEITASLESKKLADLIASDAQQKVEKYKDFSNFADDLFDSHDGDLVSDLAPVLGNIPGLNAVATGIGDFFSMGFISKRLEARLAHKQRELELQNLKHSATESLQSAKVAQAQLAVAQAGLVVAGLQRQASLLRHEFALQNLQFMRNRILNTEQWYRLGGAIRSVGDTYLRYAIEMSFLAQQAYNFESDKRLNVIRFDYDLSDVGAMLAADFLLRDLDGLEHDLVVSQQVRQQQVRYVLSMAREFPATLEAFAETGDVMFNMRLEKLERRFPGMVNMRISGVDAQPIALMDSSRFSMELTHLGSGVVRLKAQPGASPLDSSDLATDGDWLTNVETDWPVKVRVSGLDTTVFSGLTRQEIAVQNAITANERGAFEGLPGASAWRIKMSMKENRIVPNSLADLIITFTLSGYYDPSLRHAIDHSPRRQMANSALISAHEQFPDAYYKFNHTGRMDWQITPDFLVLQGMIGELRNVAVLCKSSQKRPELGRMMCSYAIEFEVDSLGAIQLLRELPLFSLIPNGLVLNVTMNFPPGSTLSFDFGDGSGFLDSSSLPHTYAKPGRYVVLIRISANGRLTEYRAAVTLSRQHNVPPPCIAVPLLQTTVVAGQVKLLPSLHIPSGESLSENWRIDNIDPDVVGSAPSSFTLEPGRYVLRFSATRPLSAHFYCQQRYSPTKSFALAGLLLTTNRTFDLLNGNDTTTNLNEFGENMFGGSKITPSDRWTFELPLNDNPCLMAVTSNDTVHHDISELGDLFLLIEYNVVDG